MVGTLVAATILFVLLFALIQFALLWAGHGAVETAVHFAARKFARSARENFGKAKEAALEEATRLCRNRPGGTLTDASITSVEFEKNGRESGSGRAAAGDAYRVRLTHLVELVVPFVNRILYDLAPVDKVEIDRRYYLRLRSTRWVTVE